MAGGQLIWRQVLLSTINNIQPKAPAWPVSTTQKTTIRHLGSVYNPEDYYPPSWICL